MMTDILLGNDLVHCQRLEATYKQFGLRFFEKLLTSAELSYCLNKTQNSETIPDDFFKKAGGRIAVKEALSKALGCGLNGLGYSSGIHCRDVEIVSAHHQPPQIKLSGQALERSNELGIKVWKVSISHDGDYALATVLGLV